MTHRAPHDHRGGLRLAVHTRRTRIIAAMIAALLSVATPVAVWGTTGLTVDGHPTRPPDDPTGLGITGALPGDPLPHNPLPGPPGDPLPALPGDLLPGLPPGPHLPAGPLGIPDVVLDAYQHAEQTLATSHPACHLSWSVLAGIGRIESGHARGGRLDPTGTTLGPILGPALDGSPGVATITDTDRGTLDHDQLWDRAVGPMQFIPTSWRSFGVDANRDGHANPHNIHDATTAAGNYLCSAATDLSNPAHLQAAIFRYNHSATYVTTVLRWAQAYLSGITPTTPAPGPIPPPTNTNNSPPIPADTAPQPATPQAATPQAAVAQPAPPAAPLPLVTTTLPPPLAPPPPATTSSPPEPPPVTTTTPPPVTTTTPSPVTTTPPATTTSPATDSSPPPPPPPTTTTTPIEPTSDPPPLPPMAAL